MPEFVVGGTGLGELAISITIRSSVIGSHHGKADAIGFFTTATDVAPKSY